MKSDQRYIFVDSSLDANLGKGFGAVLLLSRSEFSLPTADLESRIEIYARDEDSIARMEICTALWAIERTAVDLQFELVTDCQTIAMLPGRRKKLEDNHFCSGRSNQSLGNADFYRDFFRLYDSRSFVVTHIKGHVRSGQASELQTIFRLVDRASRLALRRMRKSLELASF